jgi:hypothetical protein
MSFYGHNIEPDERQELWEMQDRQRDIEIKQSRKIRSKVMSEKDIENENKQHEAEVTYSPRRDTSRDYKKRSFEDRHIYID